MTTLAVTFDYTAWAAAFPELSGVNSASATAYFGRACSIFANDTCNPAFPSGQMPNLLNLLTAHIAFLNSPRDALGNPFTPAAGQAFQPAPAIVGRVASGSEGSVSVSAEYSAGGSPSEAYFLQSRYGAEFWQATAQFRTARYFANPTTVFGGLYPLVLAGGRRRGF